MRTTPQFGKSHRTRPACRPLAIELLESRTFLTAALVQNVSATPNLVEVATPVGPDTSLMINQFNPASGTLVGAHIAYSANSHLTFDLTVVNPSGHSLATGSYSAVVHTSVTLPGDPAFPGISLQSAVVQPLVNFVVAPGPGSLSDGSDGKLLVHLDLADPKSGSFDLTPAAALAEGYVGSGFA